MAEGQSHSQPDSWQTAVPCNLFSLNCIYDHHQHTNNYSIRCTNLMSFPNETGLFFLPGLSRVMKDCQKIHLVYGFNNHTFLRHSHHTLLLPHLHKTAEIMQNSCLPCDKLFKSQYHLESALTLHLDRHNTMYDSILHTNSLTQASRETRVLTANAFSSHTRPDLPKAQIRAGLHF